MEITILYTHNIDEVLETRSWFIWTTWKRRSIYLFTYYIR